MVQNNVIACNVDIAAASSTAVIMVAAHAKAQIGDAGNCKSKNRKAMMNIGMHRRNVGAAALAIARLYQKL